MLIFPTYQTMLAAAATSSGGNIVTSDLVLHLDANNYDGSGDWEDESSSSNDFTPDNATYQNDGDKDYWSFNGTNTRMYGSNILDANNDWTFSFWINIDVGGNDNAAILAANTSNKLEIKRKDDTFRVVKSGATSLGEFTNSDITEGSIYNLTITRSGNTYSCYINGTTTNPDDGDTIGTFTSSTSGIGQPTQLGKNYQTNRHFEGRIYHVLGYDTALSASEILQNYNALKSRYGY